MSNSSKWLRIVVTDLNTGKNKTNVRIPTGLANFGLKMAAKYAPESIANVDMEDIMSAIKDTSEGKLVDVEDVEKGDHVEIYVE